MKFLKKLIIRLCLICICLLGGYSTKATDLSLFKIADSLYENGNYQSAAIEFEKAFFFNENATIQAQALLGKAKSLKQLHAFILAEKTLSRVNFAEINDTLSYNCRYESALCAYLGTNFSGAESQLIQLQSFIPDTNLIRPNLLLYSLVLNELHKWEEAKVALKQWNRSSKSMDRSDVRILIDSLYDSQLYPKLKRVEKAQKLSSFLPGIGQMYAGYFWDGFTNVSLQTMSLGLTVYFVLIQQYFTAATIGYGSFQKFYSGGITHTAYLVEQRNYTLSKQYNEQLKAFIVSLN